MKSNWIPVKQVWLGKLLVISFLIPFAIYIRTLLPYVDFWDTGEFQTVPYTFDIAHPTGYPTYLILGKIVTTLFRIRSIAYTMNLLSALLVSAGIFFISLSIFRLTRRTALSVLLAILLSLNPYLWAVAIRADPHALHFFFTAIFIFLLIKTVQTKSHKDLVLISLITGLALGNQLQSVFFIPILGGLYIYLLRKKIFSSKIITPLLGLLIGASVYVVLPIISHFKPPLTVDYRLDNWTGFARHVLGQDFRGLMFNWSKGDFQKTISFYFSLVGNSFPGYIWILIPIGLVIGFLVFPTANIGLFFIFISTLYFAMNYQNAAIERYYIPQFAVSTLWISVAVNYLIKKTNNKAVNILFYLILSLSILSLVLTNFKSIDQSKNFNASIWATSTFNSIDRNGVILSWWSYSTPLWYLQKVEGERTDVKIINASQGDWEKMSKGFIGSRPVYFIEDIKLNSKDLRLQKNGGIYKLIEAPH